MKKTNQTDRQHPRGRSREEIPPTIDWPHPPHLIKAFLAVRPVYEELAREVAYLTELELRKAYARIAAVTYRAKTLESFLEKVDRKDYRHNDPITQITDLAGVRVVFPYRQDLGEIEAAIRKLFTVVEKVDRSAKRSSDRFGYDAVHYVVELGDRYSGGRYDQLKGLRCEIQVRTILQDAWAVVAHQLVYKNEDEVPKELKRRLNSLAGTFELVDGEFERLKEERSRYINSVAARRRNRRTYLRQPINLDTLRSYIEWRFAHVPVELFEGELRGLLGDLFDPYLHYSSLGDLEHSVLKGLHLAVALVTRLQEREPIGVDSGSLRTTLAVGVTDLQFREKSHMLRVYRLRVGDLECA